MRSIESEPEDEAWNMEDDFAGFWSDSDEDDGENPFLFSDSDDEAMEVDNPFADLVPDVSHCEAMEDDNPFADLVSDAGEPSHDSADDAFADLEPADAGDMNVLDVLFR